MCCVYTIVDSLTQPTFAVRFQFSLEVYKNIFIPIVLKLRKVDNLLRNYDDNANSILVNEQLQGANLEWPRKGFYYNDCCMEAFNLWLNHTSSTER